MEDGLFQLSSAKDLLNKLAWELDQLRQSPNHAYHAFNFFVTADHMLDWVHPDLDKAKRKKRLNDSPLLQIVNHISSSAKHFSANPERHKAVIRADALAPRPQVESYVTSPGSHIFSRRRHSRVLSVHLDSSFASTCKSPIHVLELAELVYEFWLQQSEFR